MKSFGKSIVTAIKGRSLAAQAAVKHVDQKLKVVPQNVKVTTLPSGVIVASLENYSPVSRIAVLYNAGPRHEPNDNLGLSHCLRTASTLGSKKATAFNIAKNIQQIGASLECRTNREQIIYSVECLRNHLSTGFEFLNHVSSGVIFKPWEVHDLTQLQKLDLGVYKNRPEAQMIEALHKAAFRDTLGNSIYMSKDRLGSFSVSALESFVKSHYVSHNAAVAGLGVDHDALVHLARKLTVEPGTAPEVKKAKYHGGEIRHHTKDRLVHAAVVTEGVGMSSSDLMPLAVLQSVCGHGPYVKYSNNLASSKISKAASAATTGPFAASCISTGYSDAGLFGFQVAVNAKDAGKVLKAVVAALGQATKNTITEAEVQRAKRQLKACIHLESENVADLVSWLGIEAILTGQSTGIEQMDAAIDKVTLDDVNKVAKKILNGKPTMAAVGDLSHTPYLDELL